MTNNYISYNIPNNKYTQCYWNNSGNINTDIRSSINTLRMKIIDKILTNNVPTNVIYNNILNICLKEKHKYIEGENRVDFYIHELDHLMDNPLFYDHNELEQIDILLTRLFNITEPPDHIIDKYVDNGNNESSHHNDYVIWTNVVRDIVIRSNKDINIIYRIIDCLKNYIIIRLGPRFEDYYKGFPDVESATFIWYSTLINNQCLDSMVMLTELHGLL